MVVVRIMLREARGKERAPLQFGAILDEANN